MGDRLGAIVDTFQAADEDLRLELLLDFSKRLPALPERLKERADAGLNRVPECMSPVFLFVEEDAGRVHLCAAVAEEAPTVKGFMSIVLHAYDGCTPGELARLPGDLVNRLGLSRQIRMNRAIGLSAILGRIRRAGEELRDQAPSEGCHG